MISPINNVIVNNISPCKNKTTFNKNFADKVSFRGNPIYTVLSQNPNHIKAMSYIGINNISKRTKNLLTKGYLWVMKKIVLIAEPAEILKDKNIYTVLAMDKNMTIKGGLLTRITPNTKSMHGYMLSIDRAGQSKKDSLKTFFEIGKKLCQTCEEKNIEDFIWTINVKNKALTNLFDKFSLRKISYNPKQIEYSTSIERLKEFLAEMSKKHSKILG